VIVHVVDRADQVVPVALHLMITTLESDSGRQPAPGLAELEALVARHAAGHWPVDLTIDPVIADEPESIRVTVFRLVQEALTYVAKHAVGATTSVVVRAEGDGILVVVENAAGQGAPVASGSGVGLVGMRERVSLFGGEFEAHANDDGGFAVQARLPRAVPV